MRTSKRVWVEQTLAGVPIRILRDNKEVFRASSKLFGEWDRAKAVSSIRFQVFTRSGGECELCAAPITQSGGHMHEQKHRGQGGEISLENSVFICRRCHADAHSDRAPRWTKKTI
jgi:hypothetical protein